MTKDESTSETGTTFRAPNLRATRRSQPSEFARDVEDRVLSNNSSTAACAVQGGTVDPNADGPCYKKDFGDSVWYHDLSLTWERDEWTASLGVRNLFDEKPPLIDQGSGPSRMNIVVQSTYDLYGQRAFLNLARRF